MIYDDKNKVKLGTVIVPLSSHVWLAKGSLTPEGEIKIRNPSKEAVSNLTLQIKFLDLTSKKSCGSVFITVASPDTKPFLPNEERSIYFSCPNIVKIDHQLAVAIISNGRLLKQFPVVK